MHPEFHIDYRYSAGNLHIQLSGAFSRVCAWALFKTIKQRDAGAGRIFVDTIRIDKLLSAGVDSFKAYMTHIRIKPDWLYFKGEKGFAMAPDGSRVLIRKKNGRGGRWPRQPRVPLLKLSR